MFKSKFIFSDGSSYILSDEDIIWLAKSLEGELRHDSTRKDAGAVAWTMFRRFYRWPGAYRSKWSSFKDLIRAFSQPVNPAWLPGSEKCLQYPDSCTPAQLNKRVRIQSESWYEIPDICRTYALAFASNTLIDPLGESYVNFASTAYAKSIGVNVGGNYFLTDAQDKMSWSDRTLARVEETHEVFREGGVIPQLVETGSTIPSLIIASWLALTGYVVYRLLKNKK